MDFIQKADDILKDIKNRKLQSFLPNEQYSSKEFIKDIKEGDYNRPLRWLKSFRIKESSASLEDATYTLNGQGLNGQGLNGQGLNGQGLNGQGLNGQMLMPILFQSEIFSSRFILSKMEPWIKLLKELSDQKIICLNTMRNYSNDPYWLTAFNEMDVPEIWLNLVKIGANPLLRWHQGSKTSPEAPEAPESKKGNTKKEYTLWRAYCNFFSNIWVTSGDVPLVVNRSYEQQLALLPPEKFPESLFWKNGCVFSSLWNSHLASIGYTGLEIIESQGFVRVKEMIVDLLSLVPINTWPKGAIMEVQRSALKCSRPAEILSFWYDHGLPLDRTIVDKLIFSKNKSNLLEKMLYQEGTNNKNDNETQNLNLGPQDSVARRKIKI